MGTIAPLSHSLLQPLWAPVWAPVLSAAHRWNCARHFDDRVSHQRTLSHGLPRPERTPDQGFPRRFVFLPVYVGPASALALSLELQARDAPTAELQQTIANLSSEAFCHSPCRNMLHVTACNSCVPENEPAWISMISLHTPPPRLHQARPSPRPEVFHQALSTNTPDCMQVVRLQQDAIVAADTFSALSAEAIAHRKEVY